MPVNEAVIDRLAHLMDHYFADHPAADDVSAEDLARYAEAKGFCAACRDAFVSMVGADCFACAIDAVWRTAAWEAYETRRAEAEAAEAEEDG